MIMSDQPTIFGNKVIAHVSSIDDGTMTHKSLPDDMAAVDEHRTTFIKKCGGNPTQTRFVYMTYESGRDFSTYRRAEIVPENLEINIDYKADGLATNDADTGLFLPIGDCCAVVLYDPNHHALMLSHIGRQSVEVDGAKKSLAYMQAEFGSQPHDVMAWLSPAVGQASYPILRRQNGDLKQLIYDDLVTAGVTKTHIEVSLIDTAIDERYFSHSQYKKGNRAFDGRFAVFAQLL